MITITMSIRESLRNWANKPTKRERLEKERLEAENNKKASEESAQVRYYKKQLKVLENLLEGAYKQIEDQAKVISNHKEGDWMDKLIDKGLDIADNLFNTKPRPINVTPKNNLSLLNRKPKEEETESTQDEEQELTPSKPSDIENTSSSEGYSNEEIKEIVSKFDIKDIEKAAKAPYYFFSRALKNHYPEATQENILYAHTLITELAENGEK